MSDITAILNCYRRASGRNAAQVVLRSGGSVEIHGDGDLARHILQQIAANPLPPLPPTREPTAIVRRRGRPCKAAPALAAE